ADPLVRATFHALSCWNAFLGTSDPNDLTPVLEHARWLVEQEERFSPELGGWPIYVGGDLDAKGQLCLSALAQGIALSTLARAYAVSGDGRMLDRARRAARALSLDILDGGVAAPIDDIGPFFQEEARYPASHALVGCGYGLVGLQEYVALTG